MPHPSKNQVPIPAIDRIFGLNLYGTGTWRMGKSLYRQYQLRHHQPGSDCSARNGFGGPL